MKIRNKEIKIKGNFLLAVLLIYLFFFGYICNTSEKNVGESVVFLYQVLFNPNSILSLLILFLIIFVMVFREEFFEYGIRNSVWIIPIIIIISWISYWFIKGTFDLSIIWEFFIRIEGYLTIISLFGINFLTAIIASISKEKYKQYYKKKNLEELKNELD